MATRVGHGAFLQQQDQPINMTPPTGRHYTVVSRVHHGRGNELFDPKFYAEGPRDAGAALNAPMKGTFFSMAAFLWHRKNL